MAHQLLPATITVAVGRRAVRLGTFGVVTGVASGWFGIASGGPGGVGVGSHAIRGYWSYAVLFPALFTYVSRPRGSRQSLARDERRRGLVLLLAVGLVGAAIGSLLDLAATLVVPATIRALGIGHFTDSAVRTGALGAFPAVAIVILAILTIGGAIGLVSLDGHADARSVS